MRALPRARWIVLLVAGCAEATSPTAPASAPEPGSDGGGGTSSLQGRPKAVDVCHVNAWTTPAAPEDAELAVAPLAEGMAVFAVSRKGGPVTAFAVDRYGLLVGDPAGVVVRAGAYRSVRASVVDGRLIAALGDGASVEIAAVAPGLGAADTLARVAGTSGAATPVLHVSGGRVAPTADATGLALTAFDAEWRESASARVAPDAVTGFDAAQVGGGGELQLVWSTADSCHVQRALAQTGWTLPGACTAPRVAPGLHDAATLVFERAGQVGVYPIDGNGAAKAAPLLPGAGYAPRVLSAAGRTWVSYLSAHGTVVVGFVGADGRLVGTEIAEQPARGAYELAQIAGAPWVVTESVDGYLAFELCVVAAANR